MVRCEIDELACKIEMDVTQNLLAFFSWPKHHSIIHIYNHWTVSERERDGCVVNALIRCLENWSEPENKH